MPLFICFNGVAAKELSDKLSTIEIVFLEMFWSIFILFSIYKSPLKQLGGKFGYLFLEELLGFGTTIFLL